MIKIIWLLVAFPFKLVLINVNILTSLVLYNFALWIYSIVRKSVFILSWKKVEKTKFLQSFWDFPFGQRPRRGRWPMLSHIGKISPSPSSPSPSTPLEAHILALRLKSQPWGPNLSLEAHILALWLKFPPWGSNPSLKAHIPALRLKS